MLRRLVLGSPQALEAASQSSLRIHCVVEGMLGAPLLPGQSIQIHQKCQTQQGHHCEEGKDAHKGRQVHGQADQGAFSWDLVGQAEHVAQRPGYAAVPHLYGRKMA